MRHFAGNRRAVFLGCKKFSDASVAPKPDPIEDQNDMCQNLCKSVANDVKDGASGDVVAVTSHDPWRLYLRAICDCLTHSHTFNEMHAETAPFNRICQRSIFTVSP